MNWSHIYKSEVSPVLENFASGPPLWVYGIIGVLVLAATALIVWAPMKFKLGGIVLLFFCGFIGFMVFKSSRVKPGQPATFQTGRVLDLIEKKQVVKKTTGIMEPEISYRILFVAEETGAFDHSGLLDTEQIPGDSQYETEMLVSESIYRGVRKGQQVTGIILPTANNAFHFLILEGGSVIK